MCIQDIQEEEVEEGGDVVEVDSDNISEPIQYNRDQKQKTGAPLSTPNGILTQLLYR